MIYKTSMLSVACAESACGVLNPIEGESPGDAVSPRICERLYANDSVAEVVSAAALMN